jgi:hypothetical protein
MSMRESGAKYRYGLSRLRARALNDDLSRPEYNNVIGGAGPFDFSSVTATITSIPIFLKVDDEAVVSETFDLTAAADDSAVTVDECVTALTAASITGWTFSKDVTTGRLKAVNSTTGAYVQVYGTGARLMMIGQGKGIKAIKSDTMQTFTATPTLKEDTTQTVTDANGKDTEVIIEGYQKGWSGSAVDTAEDFELIELIESGTLSVDGKTYTSPDSGTKKVVIEIETYNPVYSSGSNLEDQITGWEHKTFRMCKGTLGEHGMAAGFGVTNYTLTGVNYKPKGGTESGPIITEMIDVEDWTPAMFDAV